MFNLLLSDESWLNATNALLGIVTLACVVGLGAALFHDLANKVRSRAQERRHFVFDDHALQVPDLGLTMADGGESVNSEPEQKQ
jgi:hypothetical protein